MFNISARNLFKVALQVLGVILFIKGVYMAIIYTESLIFTKPAPLYMQLTTVFMAIVPPIVGLFLLFKADPLVVKVYKTNEELIDSGPDLFRLAMKITGMVLIVNALPDAIQVISSMLYIQQVGPAMSIAEPMRNLAFKLVGTLLYFIMGSYLLVNGDLLIKLAFGKKV